MKKHALILLCLFATTASGLEGWRKLIDEEKLPALPVPPTATWTVKGDEIVVQMLNQMNETLAYFGYDPAGPQLFFEELREGKWVDTSWHWCGTGMEAHVIPPNGKREFRFDRLKDKQTYRLYTIFTSRDGTRQSLVLIYSTENPPPSK